MVAVHEERLAPLREALGADADAATLVDMAVLGRNPGRIIPAWATFARESGPGRPMRGIGEPVWAGRSDDELVECQLHEALINLAFADVDGFRLMCPYDQGALGGDVLDEARASHPVLDGAGGRCCSESFRGAGALDPGFERPLSAPPRTAETLDFDARGLFDVRARVRRHAELAGLGRERVADLVLAVGELSGNSVRHGGGDGTLRLWHAGDTLFCEVSDRGHIADPLAGRRVPSAEQDGGRGLWVTHQVCDLVQVRSGAGGTVVRVRIAAG